MAPQSSPDPQPTGSGRPRGGAAPEGSPSHPLTREGVSPLTVNRLSVYLRSLRNLEARGIQRVSSQQLASEFHLSSTQIRKDLAQFGEFGVRGVGYEVASLAAKLSDLLRLDRVHPVVLVGMGNLGTALARFPAFNSGSFLVVAGFDSDPAKVGRRIGRVPVHALDDLGRVVAETEARMAILAVPAEAAEETFRLLSGAGVSSVLNFAPMSLPSLPSCRVKNVDLRIHLEELAFFLEPDTR
ncbi:MAG TPA: redox-sensing transcriptional repressor Rex [Thermoanaerobaculia bacterium]|nr:redox-sensing transcriptional repressor Rex [Thermoanaerobaculia bacterium]